MFANHPASSGSYSISTNHPDTTQIQPKLNELSNCCYTRRCGAGAGVTCCTVRGLSTVHCRGIVCGGRWRGFVCSHQVDDGLRSVDALVRSFRGLGKDSISMINNTRPWAPTILDLGPIHE